MLFSNLLRCTSFANVTMSTRTWQVVPCSVEWPHLYTLLNDITGFTSTPVSVDRWWSIEPQKECFINLLPVQTNPGSSVYKRVKCLLFRMRANYSKCRVQYFTGILCCFPIQSVVGNLVAGAALIKPATWT